MNDARPVRSLTILIILLLILLLHLLITWNIFYKPFLFPAVVKQDVPLEAPVIKQPQAQQPQWTALKSTGGAPVILHQGAPHINASDTSEKDTQPKNSQTQAPRPEPKPESATADFNKQEIEKEADILPKERDESSNNHFKDLDKILAQSPKEDQSQKNQEKEAREQSSIVESPDKNCVEKKDEIKKPKPFSQMLNELSNQWDTGADPYCMQGKKEGKATADQLKHGNYRNKIAQCIQNGIVTTRTKAIIRNNGIYSLTVNLVIALNGSIHHLSIKESSQVPALDLFIIRAIEHAASSFPPVPPSLAKEGYPMPIHFENVINIIEHPERLHWIL